MTRTSWAAALALALFSKWMVYGSVASGRDEVLVAEARRADDVVGVDGADLAGSGAFQFSTTR